MRPCRGAPAATGSRAAPGPSRGCVLYWQGEKLSPYPGTPLERDAVSVLPWILALAGLAGLLFGFRSLRRLFSESAQRSARDRRAVESRAERDRRDCRALEMSMRDRSPDLTPEGADAKPPLRRRSTQAPHGFDPDLPVPVSEEAARM